ncbi:hypothetical protein [Alicyclobacillus fodiniaquatilis]|uniref:Uncharacterized protein n=1 Tax=Alicyclobacillus fodiniaquatilis TaxID=1661150 RepID=A0ABW4JI51_9BACL
MNRTMSIVKLHFKSRLLLFFLPWFITLFSFFINLILCFIIHSQTYSGSVATVYLYMLIIGIFFLRGAFPFAIGFSVRRTDFFVGTAMTILIINAVNALILSLLSLIENLTDSWGVNLHFFHLPYLDASPAIGQFWIDFVILLHLCFLGWLISSLFQRFGRGGLLIFFAALFIFCSVAAILCTYFNKWIPIFTWFFHHSALQLSWWLIPAIVVYGIVTYLLLRRATV